GPDLADPNRTVILKGGLVIDGTGAPGRVADIVLRGDRIATVGTAPEVPGALVLDVSGRVVAPGFIDLHTHSDNGILNAKLRPSLNYLFQGVTTAVTGNCGGGPIDVAAYLAGVDKEGAGTNVIHLIPHGSVRQSVLGNSERKADANALEAMARIIQKG